MIARFLAVFALSVSAASARYAVVAEGTAPESAYEVVDASSSAALSQLALRCGARPGRLPALVDLSTGRWRHVWKDVATAQAELESLEAASAQEDKSPETKALENEFFDLVDEIALAAGDPPMAEADAKDLGKVRAKLKKAKNAKDAASGAGKKAKADDLLELSELRGRLLLLDAELSAEDPGWKKNAKRHVLP